MVSHFCSCTEIYVLDLNSHCVISPQNQPEWIREGKCAAGQGAGLALEALSDSNPQPLPAPIHPHSNPQQSSGATSS